MERKHNDNSSISIIASISNLNNEVTKAPIIIQSSSPVVLIIEPFYGGSHKQLADLLIENVNHTFVGLSAKKWPWRARCSALILSQAIPKITTEKVLFCSSVLNLSELLGLRFDLIALKKVVYFHENQLIYPIRQIKDRDVQFAYNQITTCLSADQVIFNSKYNMDSFIDNINKIIKLLPDYRPKNLSEVIRSKSKVIYFPVYYPLAQNIEKCVKFLNIVWPHRWEFDKAPEVFLEILLKLKKNGYKFRVHLLGEMFEDVPDIFQTAKEILSDELLNYGYVESKESYYRILCESHVAVSTAKHEFFGVSMLEAAYCGCFPLVPNRLVYPEIYPDICLYNNDDNLYQRLKYYCENLLKVDSDKSLMRLNFNVYSVPNLLPEYLNLFK